MPRGSTVIKAGDVTVLGGEEYFDHTGHDLVEFTINADHEYVGKEIKELNLSDDKLIVMIQRENGEVVVPLGKTKILAGDTLVKIR